MMKELNDEKRRLTESLRAAETKREEAELKAGELAIKQVPSNDRIRPNYLAGQSLQRQVPVSFHSGQNSQLNERKIVEKI